MKKFKEYIKERKQVGKLYHFTNPFNLNHIINDGYLDTQSGRGYNYISFTRNKDFNKSSAWWEQTVRFTLDGDKLSDKYKIEPYHDPDLAHGSNEMEERIIAKKVVIKNAIKEISILKDWKSAFKKQWIENGEDESSIEASIKNIETHLKKYHVKVQK